MKYITFYYTGTPMSNLVNLGDYVQTLAVENALKKIGVKEKDIIKFNRDSLSYYKGDKAVCIMQGWFSNSFDWLPSEDIIPVYVGTHFVEKQNIFLENNKTLELLKQSQSIGCRDVYTKYKLDKLGVDSYLSRCLTLTFDKRENQPKNPKIYIVNLNQDFYEYIPERLKMYAIYVNQRLKGEGDSFKSSTEKYYYDAKVLLEEYKNNAGLVITGAIHCAMPCIAMGIPVILIRNDLNNADTQYRFSALNDLVKTYDEFDLKNNLVDWNPKVIDIEYIKQNILINLQQSIDIALGKAINLTEIKLVRENLKYLPNKILKKEQSMPKQLNTNNTWKEDFDYTDVMIRRIEKLMSLIDGIEGIDSIMDLGCGKQQAKQFIPEHLNYYPIDYIKHVDSTIQKDFNKGEFYNRKVSVCLCSGILEYIYDINGFIKQITSNCDYVLGSYNFLDTCPTRNSIWVNKLSINKMVDLFYKNGFVLDKIMPGHSLNDNVFYNYKRTNSEEYYFLFRKKPKLKRTNNSIKQFIATIPGVLIVWKIVKKVLGR